ncbi:unnamed protein product, partial [Rotaria sordida]
DSTQYSTSSYILAKVALAQIVRNIDFLEY